MFGQVKKKICCPFCLGDVVLKVPSKRGGRFPRQACPRCGSVIPEESAYCELFPVAVIGPSRSGKTHFLTVMAHKLLEEVVWPGYWTVSRVVRQSGKVEGGGVTDDEFLDFEESLYPQSGAGKILRQTERRDASRPPLSLVMHVCFNSPSGRFGREPYGRREVLLSFTDTAGEDLARTGWGEVLDKYPVLKKGVAKALIALVDPAELSVVRDEIRANRVVAGRYAEVGIELKVLATIESVLAIPQIRKTMRDIPLALCLTKTDALAHLEKLDAQSPVAGSSGALDVPEGVEGRMNLAAVSDISTAARGYLDSLNPGKSISAAASLFKYRSFFGVDALGGAIRSVETVEGQRIIRGTPQPRRVLDPLVWILWQYGFVGVCAPASGV